MLALIETGETKGRGPDYSETRFCGVCLLRITIPERSVKRVRRFARMCRKAAIKAAALGTTEICCREDFTGREHFETAGFSERSCRAIYESFAAEILCLAAEKHDRAAVFADRILDKERQAVIKLTGDFRHVLLSTGRRQTALVKALGERYGASLIENGGAGMLNDSDAAAFFAPPREVVSFSPGCALLSVTGARPENVAGGKMIDSVGFHIPESLKSTLPHGIPENELLSELADQNPRSLAGIYPAAVGFEDEK